MTIDADLAIKELTSKGIKLPPQPKVLLELQQKFASDDYSMKQLAAIIGSDPGITAMLFKAVRSPVFGGTKKLDDLEQVLMVIGVKQTYTLVQAVSLSSSLSNKARKAFEVFWTRSGEVAQIAALIAAERVSICNIFPEQAYMAGIFHECGVPVLMQRFPNYCDKLQLNKACCWPSLSEEDAQYNVDHSSIGYLVARHWKLPDFVCQAILYHHDMPREEVGTVRTLVAILQLAIHFYHRIGRVDDPVWYKLRAEVLEELGLSVDGEQDYFELISEQFLN
ncbi:MAG TPA: HDOD domain-containing protein [Gallionella sp.]|nr:HDOD domain-containing protein [Gallionella sp.]